MSDPYLGEIRMFGGNFEPAGWAFCDGRLLAIAENDALFVLIGTQFGGDGETTFALPNLCSRFPIHRSASFVLGEMAGTESVTLTTQQMPVHSHTFLATTALGDESTPAGNTPAQGTTTQLYRETAPTASFAANAISPVGGSQPHENMHPFLAITFIISLFGEFPHT